MMMTSIAIPTCSLMTLYGFSFWTFALCRLRSHNKNNPRITLTMVAVNKLEKTITGTMKVIATRNFATKVAMVASQIDFVLFLLSDS